jgi:hypothetical protein
MGLSWLYVIPGTEAVTEITEQWETPEWCFAVCLLIHLFIGSVLEPL